MRRLCIIAFCATLASFVVLPSVAQAKATSFWFTDHHTEVFIDRLACGPIGTATLTETSKIHVVNRGDGAFTVNGVNEFDYHLELSGGAYMDSGINRDHIVFQFTHRSHIVSHSTTQDFRTLYDANGTPIGRLTIHAGMHVVFDDTNGNFEPDPGEIATQHDFFRERCP